MALVSKQRISTRAVNAGSPSGTLGCTRFRRSGVLFLTLVLIVAGCSRGGNDGAPPAVPTTSPPITPPAVPTTSPPITPPVPPPPKPPTVTLVIKWIKDVGVTGGGGGSQETAYAWLMKGRCWTTLDIARHGGDPQVGAGPLEEPYRSLFEGAALACLAAFHGRTDLWKTATSRFRRIDASGLSCWDREVYDMLSALVQAHQDNPTASFKRETGQSSTCPELGPLKPDHGSRSGGYTVEVTGRNLPAQLEFIWFGTTITTTARVDRRGKLMLLVPPAQPGQSPNTVIKIADAYRTEQVHADFRYDGCGAIC